MRDIRIISDHQIPIRAAESNFQGLPQHLTSNYQETLNPQYNSIFASAY